MSDSDQRYIFIDHLRFMAAFFMIQGHVFDALLSPQVKSASWYYIHDFFHGFIAPVFLFGSGVAFGVSTIRKWEQHTLWGERTRRRLGKFIGLIAIGYALHLPYFSLRKIIVTATHAELNSWIQVDALQCIGLTLLLLQICVYVVRSKKHFVRMVAIGSVAVIFTSPLMWSVHFSGRLPMWLAGYFNGENGSWFPLFPWSAYILCGVLLGYCIVSSGNSFHIASVMRKNAALSAGFIVLAWIFIRLPFNIYPPHDFWKSDPAIFFIRLGVVSFVASTIFLMEHFIHFRSRIPLVVGKESLFVYIVHLLIVYGSVLGPGLGQFIGPTLSLIQSLGVFALVFVAIMQITMFWYDLNSRHRTVALRLKYAGAALFLLAFVIRPW